MSTEMIKFRVYDKEKDKYLPDLYTPSELAASHEFPSNTKRFYKFEPVCNDCETRVVPGGKIVCSDCDFTDKIW